MIYELKPSKKIKGKVMVVFSDGMKVHFSGKGKSLKNIINKKKKGDLDFLLGKREEYFDSI